MFTVKNCYYLKPCTVLWTTTKNRDSKIHSSEMAFLRGVKRCSKLDHIRSDSIREELQLFNLNRNLKYYKQWWKEYLERMSDSRLAKQVWNTNLQDTGVWVDPGRDGWRIFEGRRGSTLPVPCCEDDDDDLMEMKQCNVLVDVDLNHSGMQQLNQLQQLSSRNSHHVNQCVIS